MFSLVATVGKPLQVDLKTQKIKRAKVVEVDLLRIFPKRINVGMKKKDGEKKEKWASIRYEYVRKYCKTSMFQGHNEK